MYSTRQKNATIIINSAPLFRTTLLSKSCHTFMICAGSARIWNCGAFCQMRRDSPNTAFLRQKVPQSLNCSTLQDGTLRRGHRSAVLLPPNCGAFCGRKQRDLRHFFKCHRASFIEFILMCTIRTYICIYFLFFCTSVCLFPLSLTPSSSSSSLLLLLLFFPLLPRTQSKSSVLTLDMSFP